MGLRAWLALNVPVEVDYLELARFDPTRTALPWWTFPTRHPGKCSYITWRHPLWWGIRHDLIANAITRAFIWLGLWDLGQDAYYARGWWCWFSSVRGRLIRERHGFWAYVLNRPYG